MKKLIGLAVLLIFALSACQGNEAPAPEPLSAEDVAAIVAKALAAEEAEVEAAAEVDDAWCPAPFKAREVVSGRLAVIYQLQKDDNGNVSVIAVDPQRVIRYREKGRDGEVFWGLLGDGTEACVSVAYGNMRQLEGYKLPFEDMETFNGGQVNMLGNLEAGRDIPYQIYVLESDLVGLDAPIGGCDPRYEGVCIPSSSVDLDCSDISQRNFDVGDEDPHGFDGADADNLGCETE